MRVEAGESWALVHGDYHALASVMVSTGAVADALIFDAPYSDRTHKGHKVSAQYGGLDRRPLDYVSWDTTDVFAFVEAYSELCRGWWGSLTDHTLAEAWASAFVVHGRYAFAPIPCVERGSRARLVGDGPPSWTTHLVLARPKTHMKWANRVVREARGARPLPGVYIGPREKKAVVGGKPLWLMREIVGDYSTRGDLVVDPCAGAGTTLVAALEIGRRALGCEPDEGRFVQAVERLRAAEERTHEQDRSAQEARETGGDEGGSAPDCGSLSGDPDAGEDDDECAGA